ncbi:PilZ domain-containing protein [Vibrio parahaemolyticus]|uniref:PilZ domain-containing protein n=1 Tax=Vibrio parahaemolyticus TaxID=670 RepID=UPI00111E76E8|nr:PilZ domain-containing protein [Vibrio parahaemolyticus]TOL36581.1 pilus assembly protein PilZ [Vibrio parahaemolyticus]TOL49309.1 pilus assembly protein PilZ [Vibrio parahaemolyticus]HCE2153501.1 PilZ domain-containing protein [Vibrio parahaemolyticus]HCG7214476.1 PilZ domain-containing protein [Vibrio parahaemolyticus]
MQQSEILSLAERLIPVYGSEDFDFVLGQLTEEEPPSAKILVKMELNRLMAPCKKSIDLRGRVKGECREYVLDGISHWLDDVAFNAYHKNIKKFGTYTEGMWEALVNTRNNFRVMSKLATQEKSHSLTDPKSPFLAEPVHLGYDLKRQEKRLKVQSQVEIRRAKGQILHGLSIDLSSSGAKFKVPSAFKYNLGEIIHVSFTEFAGKSQVAGIEKPLSYRVLAVDDCYENDAVRYLRTIRLTETNVVARVIDEALNSAAKRARHDNQDKIIRARTRGYEHIALKHTSNLPLFFDGNELKLAMLTPNNQKLWQYWHDERNQQVFGSLFNEQRVASLIKQGVKGTSNVLYSFTHEHENKTYFYSMLRPEATREQRQLFWHLGAKRESWRAFRISIFELSEQEKEDLALFSPELAETSQSLTHIGILQEIADEKSGQDYLLTEKPRLPANTLNAFRHPRKITGNPKGIYFDAQSRRKEPRYRFKTPLELSSGELKAAGSTVDISKRGLGIRLDEPTMLRSGQEVQVNFRELQLYDKKLPLMAVPYRVIRVSPDGCSVQLVIDENSKTIRVIAFFNSIIEHNQDKLIPQKEMLPSNALLERLHSVLLSRTLSTPIFISKSTASALKTPVVGVNLPLPKHIELFARLGHAQKFSLEPIFKGRSSTLIAEPIKRVDGAQARHQDIYISAAKIGNKITAIESKLHQEFNSVKERIQFIKKARMMGDFYVFRMSTAPIFDPMTSLLRQDLSDLTQFGVHQASKLEKELTALVGYSEFEDITEEVVVRLELTE